MHAHKKKSKTNTKKGKKQEKGILCKVEKASIKVLLA